MRKINFLRKKIYFLCAVLALLLICVNVTSVQAASEAEKGRILFISSYSYGWDTVQIQIEGIKAGVNGQAVLDYEFMDTKRVNDETSAQQCYEGLKYRMSKVDPYDVVILGDDAALLFAVEHQEDLFAGIPLVFEGVNDIDLALELSKDPMITGVVEKLSVEPPHIVITCDGETIKLYEKDILYVESLLHYIVIHTQSEKEYRIKENISSFEQKLSADFYRIHRSVLVNLKQIVRISKTSVTLENGAELSLARGKYDGVNEAFIERN